MAELVIRDLPEALVDKIRRLAIEHGISMEEEYRRILSDALSIAIPPTTKPQKTFLQHLMDMPDVGEDWMFDRHDPRNATPERRKQFDFDDEA